MTEDKDLNDPRLKVLPKKKCKICKKAILEANVYFMISKKIRGMGAVRSDGKPVKPFWMCPNCFNSLKRNPEYREGDNG